jgi:ABC-type multidrug transport system ATPase subunit/ABC-type transporter Mla maintaining outer membrane lipid asymmetry permease subunit MlaE
MSLSKTEHQDDQNRDDKTSGSGSVSTSISLSELTVQAGSRRLLEKTSAHFRKGEVTLIVGPSGVGKSVLIRLIAGLVEPYREAIQWSGDIRVGETGADRKLHVGVVFQSFALFDEWSPQANVQFAAAHSPAPLDSVSVRQLLEQLRVPKDVPTSRLSGGQRQRLAIARSLAYNAPAILYDEPTSGLDPSTANEVALLIKDAHEVYGKTTVIVTHDYGSLLPIADRILLLDPTDRKLHEVPRAQWDQLEEKLRPMAKKVRRQETVVSKRSVWNLLAAALKSTSGVLEAVLLGLLALLPMWRSVTWGLKYFGRYLLLIAGPTAWIYLAVSGIIIGFVTTYFTFRFLPFSEYTEPILIDDLILAIGFSLYRIFIPLIATILIAARCGAAVTSDIGSKQYGQQIDALKTFGAGPQFYLLTPIMISFLIAVPFLNMISFFTARWTSLVTFVWTHPDRGPDFWHFHFHRRLTELGQLTYAGTDWLMLKLACCAVGIGMISYFRGRAPKYSSYDVSQSVTSTILWSTLYVLSVHFAFAFWEFE